MRMRTLRLAAACLLAGLGAGCAAVEGQVEIGAAEPASLPAGTAESYYHFILGYRDELNSRLDDARDKLSQAVQQDPKSSFLLTRLASLLVRQGNMNRAEELARRAVSLNGKETQAYLILGGIYTSRGKLTEAVAVYEKLLKLKPEETEVRLLLGTSYLELGRNQEAVDILQKLAKAQNGDVLARFYLAQGYIRLRKFDEAERELNFLTSQQPQFTRGLLMLGSLHESRGNFSKAEEIYKKILSYEPDNRQARARLGQVYIRKENLEGALKEYERLRQEEPGNLDVHRTLGFLHFERRNFQEALREFRFVLARNTKDEAVRRFVAAIYEELEQHAQAEKELHELISLVPSTVEGRLQLARLYAKGNSWEKAFAALDEAAKSHPKDARVPFARGGILMRQKKYAESVPFFQAAVELDQKSTLYRFNLASAFYELKRWDDVEAATREIIRMNPEHANALNLLGYMFSEINKNISEAEQLLNRALAIEPTNPAFLDSLGWIYYRQGRFRETIWATSTSPWATSPGRSTRGGGPSRRTRRTSR
ncbi:MAG: tetratricopeptide repeat protein [Candidatus Tectomicrobia bacterium]|nr:tetratricopeptide repeat protein [Candidatus Tectomicrobia bacterium]